MKTQKIFFLLDFLTNQLNKKKNNFLLYNKPGLEKKEHTKNFIKNINKSINDIYNNSSTYKGIKLLENNKKQNKSIKLIGTKQLYKKSYDHNNEKNENLAKQYNATNIATNSIISLLLYDNLNIVKEILHNSKLQEIRIPHLTKESKPATFLSAENINYRKVYQSLYLKQIPLQLTQLSITTTPQFKDNLTFSGEKAIGTIGIKEYKKGSNEIKTNSTHFVDDSCFYNLFIKSYATSNEKTSSKSKERTATNTLSSSDHIAYNLNTLDSIKNSNLNFSNILTPLSFFVKKKRQIVLVNKNISNKKIKKLYYNWYKIQLTRRYLNYIDQKNGLKKKNTKSYKNMKFYLALKNEHTKLNKLKFLKKSLTKTIKQ